MTGTGGLLGHVEGLLASGEWSAAAVHVLHAVQGVASRNEAFQWRELCQQVPLGVRGTGGWPEALAWMGFRCNDPALVGGVLGADFPGRQVFQAFVVSAAERWQEALQLLPEDSLPPGLLGVLAARFRAAALYELGDPRAEEAFAAALRLAAGRDRGLIWLELGYYRSRSRLDAQAREAYAQAVVWLRGDVFLLTLAHANLGIACLRLNDLMAAELALQDALFWAGRPGGEGHLSTVWRVVGGAAMQRRLPARARAAFEQALKAAPDQLQRLLAVRGVGRALMGARRFDQALRTLYTGLAEVQGPHPLWLDVAALLLRSGNVAGAREALGWAEVRSTSDGWRQQVLQVEMQRQAGGAVPPDFLNPWPTDQNWLQEEALLFPELFARTALVPDWRAPRGVVVTDGPIRLLLDNAELPVPAHRPAAALLAFLVAHGGASTSERALEALHLPGKERRERLKELSRAARALADLLGWREAVQNEGGLLRLTRDIDWQPLVYPPAGRADLFCEGRLDPWVIEWRQEHLSPLEQIT